MELVIRVRVDSYGQAMGEVRRHTAQTIGPAQDLKRLFGGLFAGFSAGLFVREMNRAFLSLDAIKRSAKVTGADLGFLEQQADRLGINFEKSALRFGQMSIAFRQAGLDSLQVKESFLAVAEAGTVLGLSADRQELALLALQQMASKNVITMEELKRQLAEHIPGALGLMAQGLNLSTEELIEMVESGNLLARDALPALAAEMRKTFGPQVDEAIGSRQAALGRLQSQFFLLKAEVGEGLPVEEFVASVLPIIRGLRELNMEFGGLAGMYAVARSQTAEAAAFIVETWTRGFAGVLRAYAGFVDRFVELGEKVASSPIVRFGAPAQAAQLAEDLERMAGSGERFARVADEMERESRDLAAGFREVAQEQLDKAIDLSNDALRKWPAAALAARAELRPLAEDTEAAAKAMKELSERGEDARDRLTELIGRLREYRELLDDVTGVNAPDLLPDELLAPTDIFDPAVIQERLNNLDLGAIWDKFFPDAATDFGAAAADQIIPAGEQVGSIWAREIIVAGQKTGVTWGDIFATAISALASVARDFGRRDRGRFGGRLSGDFADEGSAIGGAVGTGLGAAIGAGIIGSFTFGLGAGAGAAVGASIGGAIGTLLGGVIGGAIKQGADRGLARLDQIGRDLQIRLQSNEGGLGAFVVQVAEGIRAQILALESALGPFADINIDPGGGGGLQIELVNDQIRLWFAGQVHFFDTVEEAIDEGVAILLRHAEVAGGEQRPELLAALRNFAGRTADELDAVLALALEFETARLGDSAAAAADSVRDVFGKLGAAIEAGIPTEGGIAMLEKTRMAILGLTEDVAAQKAAEIDAYNLALEQQRLGIEMQILEIRAMAEVTDARAKSTQDYVTLSEAAITADGARIQSLAAVTEAQAIMVSNAASILAELEGLLGQIEGLRITGAERAAAIARAIAGRARSAGRSAGGSTVESRRSQREELDRLLQVLQGADEELLAFQDRLAAVAEQARVSGFDAERTAELLRLLEEEFWAERAALEEQARQEELDRINEHRNAVLDPWRQLLQDDSIAGEFDRLKISMEEALAALQGVVHTREEELLVMAGFEAEVQRLANRVRNDLVAAVSNAASLLDRFVGSIQDPEQRRQVQELLIRLEQRLVELEIFKAQITLQNMMAELELLGVLDEERRAWILGMLAALGILGQNMEHIFAQVALDMEERFAGPPAQLPFSGGGAVGEGERAALAILETLERLLGGQGANLNPVQRLRLEFQSYVDEVLANADALRRMGHSVEDLIDQFREIEALRLADMLAEVAQPLSDILGDLLGGSLSGLSAREQFQAQQSRIFRLMEDARSSDAETRFLAQQELGQILPGFLRLAEEALGLGFGAFSSQFAALLAGLPGVTNPLGFPVGGPRDFQIGGIPGLPLPKPGTDVAGRSFGQPIAAEIVPPLQRPLDSIDRNIAILVDQRAMIERRDDQRWEDMRADFRRLKVSLSSQAGDRFRDGG